MSRKIIFILSAWVLAITLTACRNNTESEDAGPTPEELRAEFEQFFEENKESIIDSIAIDGEDVRLEIADGYEFLMTILLDDIELDDENRTLYTLTFELTFSQMTELFSTLATDIKESADIDQFRLSVVFVDINEEPIARSNFDVGVPDDDDPEEEAETEEAETEEG